MARESTAMDGLTFDSLAYARRLKGAGFSRSQAEALAEEQVKLLDDKLVTKQALAETEARLRLEIKGARNRPGGNIANFETDLGASITEGLHLAKKITAAKWYLIRWLAVIFTVQTAVLAALIKLL